MEMINSKVILENKGYPIYTKRISDVARIYVVDGEIYKSREAEYDVEDKVCDWKINEMLNIYDNIVVEKDGIVHIFCEKDHLIERYKQIIEWLKEFYSDIENKIVFNK